MEKKDVNELEKVRKETIGLLTSGLKDKKDELARTGKSARKIYGKIRKMGTQRIHNPLLKSILKIIERWLRFWAKRLLRKIRDLAQERNAIREAIIELKNDNPDFAIKWLEKEFMSIPISSLSIDSGGSYNLLLVDQTLTERYIRLIKGLENLKR